MFFSFLLKTQNQSAAVYVIQQIKKKKPKELYNMVLVVYL